MGTCKKKSTYIGEAQFVCAKGNTEGNTSGTGMINFQVSSTNERFRAGFGN